MTRNVVLSLLWVIVCVLVILGLAYWVTKYVAIHGSPGAHTDGRSTGDLTVLSRLMLGKDQQLVVVKAGDRYFLLGVTAAQITMLAEFTPQEAANWQLTHEPSATEAAPNFGKVLKNILRQNDRR
jgi:flagellar protein FliO/FliZ